MGPLSLIVLSLVARSVDVVPGHAIVDVGGVDYHLIAPGETLEATAPESSSDVLELDFVRIGRQGKKSKAPSVHILVGQSRESVVVRSPVVNRRIPKNHPAWRASYPVRHRFPLEGGAVGGVLRIELTATDAPEGVLVALQVRTPSSEGLALTPLVPLPAPTPSPVAEKAPPSPALAQSPSPAPPSPTLVESPSRTTNEEPIENTPAPPVVQDVPVVEEKPAPLSVAPERSADAAPASTMNEPAPPRFPVWMHGQLTPLVVVQPAGGLSPLALSLGGRFILGMHQGALSRFGLGIGLDFGLESASTRPGSIASSIRWTTLTSRIRLEGEARLVELDLGTGRLSIGAVVGAGVIVGGHVFSVGDAQSVRPIFGPTLRVGPMASVDVGPGALTATLPLDVSADLSSGVRGYWPFASTLLVGYRLAL